MQSRVDPNKVVEAYKKTKLKPRRNLWLENGCACGLGVLYARKIPEGVVIP